MRCNHIRKLPKTQKSRLATAINVGADLRVCPKKSCVNEHFINEA